MEGSEKIRRFGKNGEKKKKCGVAKNFVLGEEKKRSLAFDLVFPRPRLPPSPPRILASPPFPSLISCSRFVEDVVIILLQPCYKENSFCRRSKISLSTPPKKTLSLFSLLLSTITSPRQR